MDNFKLLKFLKSKSKNQYQDILIYNELYEYCTEYVNNDKKGKNNKKLSESLNRLMDVYDKLYNYGFSVAGYQFIGLAISTVEKPPTFVDQLSYLILSIGFVLSIFGALLSFCMYEYINGIKEETNEFIVLGLLKYRFYLFIPHPILLFNSFLFIIPLNILIHNLLTYYFAIIFNIFSGLLCIGFYIHKTMIIDKQIYDINFNEYELNNYDDINLDINKSKRYIYQNLPENFVES